MSNRMQAVPQLVADLRGVEPFGAPSYVQPEGRYVAELVNLEYEPSRNGNGINIIFHAKLGEPGFEGSNYEHQLWVPNSLVPQPGMDNKMIQAIDIARRRLVSALLSFGYTQQQIDGTNALPIGNPATWVNAPGGRRYYILVEHKWGDVMINQTTKQPITDEKTGRLRHHLNDEVRFVVLEDYTRAQPARRDVKSAIQMLAERGEYPIAGGQVPQTPQAQVPFGVPQGGQGVPMTGWQPSNGQPSQQAGFQPPVQGFVQPPMQPPAPATAVGGFPGQPTPNGTFPGQPNPQGAAGAFAGFPR